MTDLTPLFDELMNWFSAQKLAAERLTQPQREAQLSLEMAKAIRLMYIRTCRGTVFTRGMLHYDDLGKLDGIDAPLSTPEEELISIYTMLGCIDYIKGAYATIVSYTTNALSVANADKPFANLEAETGRLKDKEAMVFLSQPAWSQL